jgi:hypothetical protein
MGRMLRTLTSAVLWAAFTALLLGGADRMLRACDLGLLPLFGALTCAPAPVDAALQVERERRATLRASLHAAQVSLAELPICAPPQSAKVVELPDPIKPPEPPKAVDPPKRPEPVNPPEPEPKPSEKLVIPKKVEDLKGCWQSARGDIVIYADTPGQKPVATGRFCYCFADNGRGTARIKYDDGRICSGPLVAKLRPDKLSMRHNKLACTGDEKFSPQDIVCVRSETGETTCESRSFGKYAIVKRLEEYVRVSEDECDWHG